MIISAISDKFKHGIKSDYKTEKSLIHKDNGRVFNNFSTSELASNTPRKDLEMLLSILPVYLYVERGATITALKL